MKHFNFYRIIGFLLVMLNAFTGGASAFAAGESPGQGFESTGITTDEINSVLPVFVYPVDGQTLDYEGAYLFKVKPIASAEGFLWGFFQNGVMVWENWRDEGMLSGNEYGIHPGSLAHSKFVPGYVEVWVRASFNGQWSDAAVITIKLRPVSGSLDPSFGNDGTVTTDFANHSIDNGSAIALQPDGKILVAGSSGSLTSHKFALVRYNRDGSLDTSFSGDGMVTTAVGVGTADGAAVALQKDGKIVMAGTAYNRNNADFALVRYNRNGSLDTTFGKHGKVLTDFGHSDDYGYGGMVIQPNGKIIVAGYRFNGVTSELVLARYNRNGSLDKTFGAGGKVILPDMIGNAIALQSNGRIIVAGSGNGIDSDFALARFRNNGSLDASFGSGGFVTTDMGRSEIGYAVFVGPGGKIIVAGLSSNGQDSDFALARYNPNGSLDTSFDGDGIVTTNHSSFDVGFDVAAQPNGKITLAGQSFNGIDSDIALVRYNRDGSLDTTFDRDGIATTHIGSGNNIGSALALQPDGKIVVAGWSCNAQATDEAEATGGGGGCGAEDSDFSLARYDPAIQLNLDIQPGDDANAIDPNSPGLVRVAVLSRPGFNARTMLDRNSLTFGRSGEENSLIACQKKGEDVNYDGLVDLICDFSVRVSGFRQGDTVGILKGKTIKGIPVTGYDSVRIE